MPSTPEVASTSGDAWQSSSLVDAQVVLSALNPGTLDAGPFGVNDAAPQNRSAQPRAPATRRERATEPIFRSSVDCVSPAQRPPRATGASTSNLPGPIASARANARPRSSVTPDHHQRASGFRRISWASASLSESIALSDQVTFAFAIGLPAGSTTSTPPAPSSDAETGAPPRTIASNGTLPTNTDCSRTLIAWLVCKPIANIGTLLGHAQRCPSRQVNASMSRLPPHSCQLGRLLRAWFPTPPATPRNQGDRQSQIGSDPAGVAVLNDRADAPMGLRARQ